MTTYYEKKIKPTPEDLFGVELHVHLDGSVPSDIVYRAAIRQKKLPDHIKSVEDMEKVITLSGKQANLKTMLDCMYFYLPIISDDYEALYEMALSFCKQQYSNHVYYTEARYDPHSLSGPNLSPEQVVVIINKGLSDGCKKYNIIVKTILCCMREWKGDKRAGETLELAHKYKNDGIVGIDLAGNEISASSKEYGHIFAKAKKLGLHITIHAGEGSGHEAVLDAIHNLHAERIGHGYRCLENDKTLELVIEKQIHLECCPTSSITTNAVEHIDHHHEDWKHHPIAILAKSGVNYSINTDDPCVMKCNLLNEYFEVCIKKIGLSKDEVAKSIVNAAKSCFLDGDEKEMLIKTIQDRISKKLLI